ncbi:hypothetical protein RND81_12G235300 [Saponaria officinalis]|uniref:Homeobox domain-containing protein n=1 Tax=Saponaria officinalis TaxID=3572 RepID=A0AAW1HEF3_SAPOF
MGRPPSNGAPSFRFNPAEVAQMEAILKRHEGHVPPRDLLVALAQRFSQSPERAGKTVVQMKQVWNWFQNRRYALRAKSVESSGKPINSPVTRNDVTPAMNVPSAPHQTAVSSGPHVAGNTSEAPIMEFEAKSARDGAWYDVQMFIALRHLETDNPEVLVRFAGFGPEEDEWVNIVKHVRQRSLPCEASECIVVLPGDLILCFQEGKEQALYFDAHVLDAQRRRHDVRGCRCRFLVRYDHDQSEEIVPLRKICRRPDTDYRLQQLNATNEAPVSTSVPVGSATPVVGPTATTTFGTTNPNPATAAVTVSPSPIITAGPSLRPPAPAPTLVRAPTPFPVGPPAPTPTPTPPTSFSTSTPSIRPPVPEPKKVGNVNLAQIPVPDQMKVENVNPNQIAVPDPKKDEIGNPAQVSVSGPKIAESVDPAQIAVLDPMKDAQISVFGPKIAESVDPVRISVSDSKKVESDNPTPVLVPVPEVYKVETVSPTPVQVPLPGQSKVETDIPAFAPIPVPETIKAETESDNPVSVRVPELNKVASDNPVSVPGLSKVETGIPAFAPVPVPETSIVESGNPSDNSLSEPEPNKVVSDMSISVPEPDKVEGDVPISVLELNNVASDEPVSEPEPNKVVSDMSISVAEPNEVIGNVPISVNKVESDISLSATEPNKVEIDIPVSAPEPKIIGSDIPVLASEPDKAERSINLRTSVSEAAAQAKDTSPGAVNKILDANQADNSKPDTVALTEIKLSEEQPSGNLTITVPGPEKAKGHDGSETVSAVGGSTESTVATEDVN